MTLEEFYALPTIASSFPLTFSSGNQTWTSLTIDCNSCHRTVSVERTRGSVTRGMRTDGYRSAAPDSYNIVAHALCPKCNELTTAEYVLHEDMTLTGKHPRTGEPSHWRMRRATRLERVIDWCKSLLRDTPEAR